MSRTHKDSPHARSTRSQRRDRDRHISVRAVRRDPPDLKKLSRALIQLAMAQAEVEAEANGDSPTTSDISNGTQNKWPAVEDD